MLISCKAGDGDGDDSEEGGDGGDTTSATRDVTTDDRGKASALFTLPAGTTKFAATAATENSFVKLETIADSSGTDFLTPGGEIVSLANDLLPFLNNASVPSRERDPEVDPEQQVRLSATATNSNGAVAPDINMTLSILTKSDSDLSKGQLHVNLFFVGSVAQDSATHDAIIRALDEFRQIYKDSAGISLDVSQISVDGPAILPLPIEGANFYLTASRQAQIPGLNIFLAGDVEDSNGNVLGIAGGIPGPAIPSQRSGVTVSILTGAGPDGVYSNLDIRILGETMAHESGHYLGLFHPIDFNSRGAVVETDPLRDTPTCSTQQACLDNPELTNNLLYPSPVSDNNGGLIPQNNLSSEQRAVLNRYILVD